MKDPATESGVRFPDELVLIAGRDRYPLLLAREARAQGVRRITALAFRGETSREITRLADRTLWFYAGALGPVLEALRKLAPAPAVLAGQIRPVNLFRLRFDARLAEILRALPVKTAHTIFGALVEEVEKTGVHVLPASMFMQRFIPAAGTLTTRKPDARQVADIELGRRVIKETGVFDIGQTVVVKEGVVLAVEAFEGTDRAVRRGGRLGGPGAVVVKVPRRGHDHRFDIPVIGRRTLRAFRRAGIGCLALEEGGAVMLDREACIAQADRAGIAITVLQRES